MAMAVARLSVRMPRAHRKISNTDPNRMLVSRAQHAPDQEERMSRVPKDSHFEARVRESFEKQVFMSTLGATLDRIAPGEVTIVLPVRPALLQQHGSVHAGAITSVLDSAAGYAALSLMPPGAGVVSVEFKVNLLEPAVGERIEARPRVVRSGRTLSICTADAWAIDVAGAEKLVAMLQGTMMCLVGNARVG